jgi:hypothetical protein
MEDKVGMKLPLMMWIPNAWRGMQSHRVREWRVEDLIVVRCNGLQNRREIHRSVLVISLTWVICHRGRIMTSNGHTAQYGTTATKPGLTSTNRSPNALPVQNRRIAEPHPSPPIGLLSAKLRDDLIRNRPTCLYLSVRMRVARPHHRAVIKTCT